MGYEGKEMDDYALRVKEERLEVRLGMHGF